MPTTQEEEQDQAVRRILDSTHRRKLIVAGAGAGKTTVFKKLLEQLPKGASDRRLVVTFINILKNDLDLSLGHLARVFTFHGLCRSLLHRHPDIRTPALTDNFTYFPPLLKVIKSDWTFIRGGSAPKFAPAIRNLESGDELAFFESRSSYYDAVGFDDSVLRVHRSFEQDRGRIPAYEVVIVDEFQDFNRSEVEVLKALAHTSALVIAGDDDQALYGKLRDASETFIRDLYNDPDSEQLSLPFCMRCPAVIVDAANDVLRQAAAKGLLVGRIPKPYKPFAPDSENSQRYNRLRVVQTSVQLKTANYFGKYIKQQLEALSEDDIRESYAKDCPTVLVIGANPYLRQVRDFLTSAGIPILTKADADDVFTIERRAGLELLKKSEDSNLGWRIVTDVDDPAWLGDVLRKSEEGSTLGSLIPQDYRSAILAEVAGLEPEAEEENASLDVDETKPTVKLVSFEGSKGLSAMHVFIVGLQQGTLPGRVVKDVDVCKFVVALTRTRRQCHLLYTTRFASKVSVPSDFISWIADSRKEHIAVNKTYWT